MALESNKKILLIAVAALFWPAVILAFYLGRSQSTSGGPSFGEGSSPVQGESGRPTGHAQQPREAGPLHGGGRGTQVPATGIERPGRGEHAHPGGLAAGAGGDSPQVEILIDHGAREMSPGEIVELNYEFASAEERQAHELDQKRRWEMRKAREIVAVTDYLTRELKLDAGQSLRLRQILESESQRRVQIVTDHMEGRIDRNRFRQLVDQSRETGRQELAALFTPAQMATYRTLEPRRQVLIDGTIGPD